MNKDDDGNEKSHFTPEEIALHDSIMPARERVAISEGRKILVPVCAKDIIKMPAPREWAWKHWMPTGSVTGLGGAGGVGKSTLAQQIATHKATGRNYLDCEMAQAPALFLTCEDDKDELIRRQFAINNGLNVTMNDLSDLYLLSRIGDDSMLVNLENNIFQRTVFFTLIDELMGDLKLKMAFFDLIPDYWNGNEIIRQQVNSFVKSHLGYLADRHKCAVVALYHPSQSGKNSGSGESGSTAWDGSFRSRIYVDMDKDSLERTIQRKKSNYAETNDGNKIIWDDGYFMEAEKMNVSPAEQKEGFNKEAFLLCMRRCEELKIPVTVGANSSFPFKSQFPMMWREMDKRHTAITGKQFSNAYTSLLTSGQIEQYQPRGKGTHIKLKSTLL